MSIENVRVEELKNYAGGQWIAPEHHGLLDVRQPSPGGLSARAEVKRALENTEVACGMPVLQQGDKLVGASFDIDGEVLRVPLGVFGMIPPFNFPLMVPFWFFPYALATGNTYVVKPSEQTPCCMQRVAELIEEAGFPPGVVNMVHGDKRAAQRLL